MARREPAGPIAVPADADAAAVTETHLSVVFFVGDRAYKLKKPVTTGFVDLRTRAAREALCHREVEVNRRLAPDVYLGVADVHDPDGEVCDHLVVMRRMPVERRLSAVIDTDPDIAGHLHEVARLVAAFHAGADRSPAADRAGSAEATEDRWRANTAELEPYSPEFVDPERVVAVDARAADYLAGRGPLFESRVAAGRAVDGHGDLLADDIFLLDDGPRILDSIEFDDDLRLGDTLADVAFLAMDLERLGRADLADRFLDDYRRLSGDAWPASLRHHHTAYRAQVRAKVAAIRASQGDAASRGAADRLLDLALAHLHEGRVRLILVGGLPGTGKSTLAAGLADALGAVVLRTDELRDEAQPRGDRVSAYRTGRYRPEAVDGIYAEAARRAGTALGLGETVILDASFAGAGHRAAVRRLARDHRADLLEVRCTAPAEVAAERLRARAAAGDDPSEADEDVARRLAAEFDPWPEAHDLATDRPPGDAGAAAAELARRTPA